MEHGDPLIAALREPAGVVALRPDQWNALLQQAAKEGLLGRLATELEARGLLDRIPAKARSHLVAGRIAAQSSQVSVRFELNRVLRALAGLDVPVVLLKGAAYLLAELPPARGRSVGDLDLMVPRARIDEVERALTSKGWAAGELDAYDERHYRERAHEIPPLQHPGRDTPVDVHHTIVPLTSRVHPDAAALFDACVPLADGRLRVLGPADMLLHSAVHLFNDEVGKPLRDLFDLDDLLRHFGTQEAFWAELIERAQLHGLGRPAYYMVRYTQRLLGTPVPADVARAAGAWAPARPLRGVMDWIFVQRFLPDPVDAPRRGAAFARWLFYVRTHWLRMPPLMLARHLTVKGVRRLKERWKPEPGGEDF